MLGRRIDAANRPVLRDCILHPTDLCAGLFLVQKSGLNRPCTKSPSCTKSPFVRNPGFALKIALRGHFWCSRDVCTKNRVDIQGVHCLYEHADVVRQNLAECFVNLPGIALGTQGAPELSLYHAEGRFYIASLMVVLHEGFTLVHEQVVHLRPRTSFGGL